MQVLFKAPQTLGNKSYKAGSQVVPDQLYANQKFKQLVKSGHAIVQPKDANAQKMQHSKDEMNARKSETARQLSKTLLHHRVNGVAGSDLTEAAVPGTMQKLADKQASQK